MKRYFALFLFTFLLVSCSPKTDNSNYTASSSTKSSHIQEVNILNLTEDYPHFSEYGKKVSYLGTGKPDSKVLIKFNGKDVNELLVADDGVFRLTFTAPTERGILTAENDGEVASIPYEPYEEKTNNSSEEKNKLEDSHSDNSTTVTTESDAQVLLPYQKEASANAELYPAKPGAMLYDKKQRKYTGMNYFFDGEIIKEIKLENISGGNAWLVKNSQGYVMPVEYYHLNASVGDSVKIWGTLSGLGFSNTDLDVNNVVGMTGSMHAISIELNGIIQN